MRIDVAKMHGAGNDFVVVSDRDANIAAPGDLAVRLCDRHFGIGADGLLILSRSDAADVKMRIFNADGTEAQMCGNGLRCVGKYIYDNGLTDSLQPLIETMLGVKSLILHPGPDGLINSATVDMGSPSLLSQTSVKLNAADRGYDVWPVSTGNPHGVVEVNDADSFDVSTIGPLLEKHTYWPDKANIEFVTVRDPHTVVQRTWERGVGETLACGTGACASAYALVSAGKTEWPVKVILPGGILTIDFADNHLIMTGDAALVFQTVIDL